MRPELAASRPARERGFAARHRLGTHTIEDDRGARRFEINATALAVWDLSDGNTTAAEMVDAMALIFDAPANVVEEDVGSALELLASLGILRGIGVSG